MKTIELKWIEDDNHIVAEDAYNGLKELIETGVFPNLTVKCENDTLYITGEKEDLDKVVMKIQKAYAKYGQIMIKEAKNGTTEELRIESFDDNVQDIFNHTLAEYETFKENTKKERPNTYITTLGKFQYKFNKLKEAASKKDKKILQNILMEINELTESYEEVKFKPKNTVNEDSLDYFNDIKLKESVNIDQNKGDILDDVKEELKKLGYGIYVSSALIKDNRKQIIKLLKNGNTAKVVAKIINNQYLNEDYNYFKNPFRQMAEKRKRASEEKKRNLSKDKFSKKFLELAQTYAGVEDLDIEVAYDKLMSDNRVFELVDSTMTIEDIMDMISAGELLQ